MTSSVNIALFTLLTSCCVNVIFLEHLIEASPDSGNILLFLQFSFIALEGFIFGRNFGREKRHVPLKDYATLVSLFFISSATNNMALAFGVPMPLHMIFKSGSLVANMVLGSYLLKRTYTMKKYLSVLMVTFGILICTYVMSGGKSQQLSEDESSVGSAAVGVLLLSLSLLVSARTGIYQESVSLKYGKHARETLFYNHALPLPLFVFLAPSISRNLALFSESEPATVPFLTNFLSSTPYNITLAVPILWQYVAVNVVTQYLCIRSVFYLIAESSSLTVTLLLTLRKFISLVFSVVYFQNEFTTYHWVGTAFVFMGSLLYSDAISFSPKTGDGGKNDLKNTVTNGRPLKAQKAD